MVDREDDPAGRDLGLVDRRNRLRVPGSLDRTQENCGVFTAGIWTTVMRTPDLSCSSSQRTEEVNPLIACLAPQ